MTMLKQWANVVLGLVVVVAAYMGAGTTWLAVLGILVAVVALWSALEKKPGA
jgi:hypothetical protein